MKKNKNKKIKQKTKYLIFTYNTGLALISYYFFVSYSDDGLTYESASYNSLNSPLLSTNSDFGVTNHKITGKALLQNWFEFLESSPSVREVKIEEAVLMPEFNFAFNL